LMDPSNLAGHRVIIPEGKRLTEIWELLSTETGIPVEDFEAAAEDYTAYGIPENEAGSLEGYLWPGRYDIYEDQTAEDVIAMMWGRMEEELTAREIPEEKWHRTLTVDLPSGELLLHPSPHHGDDVLGGLVLVDVVA